MQIQHISLRMRIRDASIHLGLQKSPAVLSPHPLTFHSIFVVPTWLAETVVCALCT